jgi:hypothetical protein
VGVGRLWMHAGGGSLLSKNWPWSALSGGSELEQWPAETVKERSDNDVDDKECKRR